MSYQPPADMFQVRTAALTAGGNIAMPNCRAIVVDPNNGEKEFALSNTVSAKYEVHQPSDILSQFESVADATGLEIRHVLTNPLNASMLISARYQGTQFLNEDHDVNVVFYTSHDSKYPTFLTLQALRIACLNQAPMLAKGGKRLISEKHYRGALDIERVGSVLESVPASVMMYGLQCEQLADSSMKRDQFVEWYAETRKLDPKSGRYDSTIRKVKDAYDAPENSGVPTGTKYAGFHAITWLNTHGLSNSKFRDQNRITKAADDTEKMTRLLLAA